MKDTSRSPRPPSSGCDSLFAPRESTFPSNPTSGTKQMSSALLDRDSTPSSGGVIPVFGLSKSRFNRVSSVLMSNVKKLISTEPHLFRIVIIFVSQSLTQTHFIETDKDYRPQVLTEVINFIKFKSIDYKHFLRYLYSCLMDVNGFMVVLMV